MIKIRRLQASENARVFQENVNALVAQNARILVNRPQTLRGEKKWLKELGRLVRTRRARVWVVEAGGRAVGVSEARRGVGRESDNVELRVGIIPTFQNKGIGTKLMKRSIRDAKRWKAKIIWLSVLADNKSAISLYKKLGFSEVARLPKWADVDGKRVDKLLMVLRQ